MALVYRIVPDLFNSSIKLLNKNAYTSESVLYELGYINFSKAPMYIKPNYEIDSGRLNSFSYKSSKSKGFFLFPYDAVLAFRALQYSDDYFFGGAVVLEYDIPDEILSLAIGIGNYRTHRSQYFSDKTNTRQTLGYPVLEFNIDIKDLAGGQETITKYSEALISNIKQQYTKSQDRFINNAVEEQISNMRIAASDELREEYKECKREKGKTKDFLNSALAMLGTSFLSQYVTGRTLYVIESPLFKCIQTGDFSPMMYASDIFTDKRFNQFNFYKNNYGDVLKEMGFYYHIDGNGAALMERPMSDESIERNNKQIIKTIKQLSN